jgi:hypothetical protein
MMVRSRDAATDCAVLMPQLRMLDDGTVIGRSLLMARGERGRMKFARSAVRSVDECAHLRHDMDGIDGGAECEYPPFNASNKRVNL